MATTNKLKIGLVLDDSLDKPDGVQQYVLSIGEWLRAQGHDVHYLVGQTERIDLKNVHSLSRNIGVRFNGNRLTIPRASSRQKLRALMVAEQFDVLHVQMPYHPLLAHRLILAAGPETVVIGTFHIVAYSPLVQLATRVLAVWLRRSLARFDKLFSVSTAAVDYARQTFKIETTVSPNVIDYPRFHLAKGRPEYDDGQRTILFLGRLVQRKGCLLLLRAVTLLARDASLPKFRVVICGKGPLLADLEQYVVDHQLQDIVQFVGFVSEADKPSYYASADIAVFPSSGGESFGIVLLEAMASGKAAVLAGDNSGYHSVMAPEPRLLFDPHDAAELALKLEHLLKMSHGREAAAAWGKTYSKTFDVAIVGRQLLKDYQEALHKRRSP